jgi:hypothetical protein
LVSEWYDFVLLGLIGLCLFLMGKIIANWELYTEEPRKHRKESTFGSRESVEEMLMCEHNWIHKPSILFGYLEVDYHCIKCKAWKRRT